MYCVNSSAVLVKLISSIYRYIDIAIGVSCVSAKAVVGVYLDRGMKKKVAVTAASLGVRASRLYVLGVRIVLVLLEEGRLPPGLVKALEERDPGLLEDLRELLRAKEPISAR